MINLSLMGLPNINKYTNFQKTLPLMFSQPLIAINNHSWLATTLGSQPVVTNCNEWSGTTTMSGC